jgi:hypothetical protein
VYKTRKVPKPTRFLPKNDQSKKMIGQGSAASLSIHHATRSWTSVLARKLERREMPTDPTPPSPPATQPRGVRPFLRRQLWFCAVFMAWGAFELGRWVESPDPGAFFSVVQATAGTLLIGTAVFGLRAALQQLDARPSGDPPSR